METGFFFGLSFSFLDWLELATIIITTTIITTIAAFSADLSWLARLKPKTKHRDRVLTQLSSPSRVVSLFNSLFGISLPTEYVPHLRDRQPWNPRSPRLFLVSFSLSASLVTRIVIRQRRSQPESPVYDVKDCSLQTPGLSAKDRFSCSTLSFYSSKLIYPPRPSST